MKKFIQFSFKIFGLVSLLAIGVFAQQVQHAPFDVTGYQMDIQIVPSDQKLIASVDVSFTPLADTRSVEFELNGSLKIDSITRVGGVTAISQSALSASQSAKPVKGAAPKPTPVPQAEITFIQDQAGVSDLGPSVRIDLGDTITKGTPVTLRFKYSGVLNTAQGGPLLTKRLAYIGENRGYLMYAARWFPFHNYAADPATSDISVSIPAGLQLIGVSDTAVAPVGGKYRFVQSKPALIGNFAYGKYVSKTLRYSDFELQFNTRVADDAIVGEYGEILGRALDYYTKKYGAPDAGKKLIIAQVDDESLDFYSTQGMIFIANRLFDAPRGTTEDRLQREAAYQWWGLTVGLETFDDAWLSQGLAEYSAFSLRESTLTGAQLEALRRELLEKSLTFEQTASLARVPANLDDQSVAYNYIMYSKGAFAYKLLRDTMGAQKFDQLLRTYLQEFRGKNASIDEFEKLASKVAGNNLRYFFARWVEGTGVPEFQTDYLIIRTRSGKFVTRGTVKQNYDNLRLPVEIQLLSEGENKAKTVTLDIEDASADFNIESEGKPLGVVVDPNYKILRISPDLRVSAIARRGIEQFKEGNYVEAQAQFEAALKLDRSNSWIYYHLGLLFLQQRNYDLAIDNFKATLGGNISPTWLSVWANIKMGNAYDAKGDRTRAVSAYKRAEAMGDNYDNAQDAVKRYLGTPFDPKDKSGQNTTAIKE
jgi:tetratricopeptide (TPR) repeat protein